jgi:hypothetical protein
MAVQLSLAWFAWKNLGRRQLKTLLTLGGIAVTMKTVFARIGFLRSFEHVKEFTCCGLRQNGGVRSASQVKVKIRGQAESTLLTIDRGTTKANLDLRTFSPEQLTDF